MLDLCCGFKGASEAMRRRGWEVITVDVLRSLNATYTCDLRQWTWHGARPDLVWASPPCQEFSRHTMPWLRAKNPPPPDTSIIEAAQRIIRECNPRWWIIENVRGAVPYLGEPTKRIGPFCLWGVFPDFEATVKKGKERLSGWQKLERARVPLGISIALADACEQSRNGRAVVMGK